MSSFVNRAAFSIVAGIAVVHPAPLAAQADRQFEFTIPAQPLSQSLRQIAVQSGTNIVAPAELVEGKLAAEVRGRLRTIDAVSQSMAGSGLEARLVGGSIIVATVASKPARVAEDEGEPNIIVVTGTNLRGAQPTSPIISIGRRDIEASGANNVEQLMAKLPQNAQSGVNRENFRTSGAGADPTEHGAGLNLRGLGQRATLVLVNGRRLAPSNAGSFVDISLIPLGIVERVEILTDGASAVYGSDAVGGVVNFILKDSFKGFEAGGLIGTTTRGGGQVVQANLAGGTSWASGSALLSYEFRSEKEIEADDRSFTINLAPQTSLTPDERRHSLFGNISQQLATNLRSQFSAGYSKRRAQRSYFFTGSPVPVDLDAEASMLSFGATLDYDVSDRWQLKLSGGYSRTRTDQLQDELGGQGLVNSRRTRNSLADAGLALAGSLVDLPAGPIRLALGAEWRRERFADLFETNNISSPVEAGRSIWAGYGELQLPIFSGANRKPGLERLILSAAGRYERYDDFGSTFNPKLGFLWSPLPGLSLRSSFDTSFRAPLLNETAGTYSAIYVPASLVFVDPQGVSGVALALGGSNPEVKPERSRSWTLGLEYEPPQEEGLKLALNYYSIRFTDRIALPSQTIAIVGDPAFDSIVFHDPDDDMVGGLIGGAQVALDISGPNFTNGNATPADVVVIVDGRINNTARAVTKGIDASLGYRFGWRGSQFRLGLNANYILSFKDQLRPSSPAVSVVDTPFRPLDLRIRAHAGWRRGGWAANLFLNHAGGYRDNRGSRSLRVNSFTTLDGSVSFRFDREGNRWLRGLRVDLSGDNLLDRRPPLLLPDPGSFTGLGYDPVNASGRGRFLSLGIRKSW